MLKTNRGRIPFISDRDTQEPKTIFWIRELNPLAKAEVMDKLKKAGLTGEVNGEVPKDANMLEMTEAFLFTVHHGLLEIENFEPEYPDDQKEEWLVDNLDFETLAEVAGAILKAKELLTKN